MTTKKEINTFLVLPYVDLEKDFNMGNLFFYSFARSGEKFIKDKWLYEKVKSVIPCFARFNRYKFNYHQYCDGTLIHQEASVKIKLNPYDFVELISYVELHSAYDTPNTWDIRPVVITRTDKKVTFNVANNSFEEAFINKMVFYPPDFLEMRRFNPDYLFPKEAMYEFEESNLLRGLISCLLDSNKRSKEEQKEYRRIIAAIKFRNQSERKEYKFKENIRIILIAAAFEALFNLSSQEIGQMFQRAVTLLLGSCTEDLQHWARQFYDLRSRIVHGNDGFDLKYQSPLKDVPKHIDHYLVARRIFDECLRAKLYLMGLHNQYQYNRPYTLPEVARILIPNKKKIYDLLKFKPEDIWHDKITAFKCFNAIADIRERDGSTTNEDCLKAIKLIRNILEEIIKNLLASKGIAKDLSVPLEGLLKTLKEKPCDKRLYLELWWTTYKYDKTKNDRNKLWNTRIVHQYLSIENIITQMQRLSELVTD